MSIETAEVLEEVQCPLCASSGRRVLMADLRDHLELTDATFNLVECTGCRCCFISPRPKLEHLARFYPPAYWYMEASRPPVNLLERIKALEAVYRRGLMQEEIRRLLRYVGAGKRLLDVGCGGGDIVKMAREAGFEAAGVEFSADAVAYGRARGLDVAQGTLEGAAFPDASFDGVSLFHVLEHLPDPVGTLREVRRILKPGGVLLVQVPNFGSLQAAIFRRQWFPLDVPRHFHQFTPESLQQAFKQAGFEPIALDHHSFRCNPVTFVSSMFPSLEPHLFSIREKQGRSQLVQKALYLLMTWVFAPWTWFESLLGRGAVITLVGKPLP